MKLPAFFQRFQTEERVLRVNNKTKSNRENAFHGYHFETEGNHESSNNEKKPCFGYFCSFVTCALTLRSRNIISMFFKDSLVFAVFKPLPVGTRS